MAGFLEPPFSGTDRFTIERQLGSGGFGTVYSAYDRKRNARVAIKLLHRADPASIYRFKQEFRALSDLVHPNLISMYELLCEGNRWFFTMELVDGVDFLTYVRGARANQILRGMEEGAAERTTVLADNPSPARIDWRRLRAVTAQLAAGLCALHQSGKLHRDLKPSNVLVTAEDRLVILDFGLVSDLSREGLLTAAGTPGYMPPEVARAGSVVEASDWYSVGVMLFEAITGRLPRRESSEPPAPGDLVADVPDTLNEITRDLLREEPHTRPSGAEFLRRLQFEQPESAQPRSLFVGRISPLETLQAAFAEARSHPVVALIHGNSGIGKTALTTHFLNLLRRHHPDTIVLAGRCYQREAVPHKAVDSLVDALSRHLKHLRPIEAEGLMPRDISALAHLFPVLRQVESIAHARRRVAEVNDVQELRRRAFSALKELLARMADERPLVLCIDDLHWGDVDSLSPLVDIVSPPDPPGLLLMACYRTEEASSSPLLKHLLPRWRDLGPRVARDLELSELPPREAVELARLMAEEISPESIELAGQVARESGGNPFWITELTRRQNEQPKTFTRLEEVVLERVSHLPREVRRLLEIIAVSGGPVEASVACRAAGLDGAEPGMLKQLSSLHFVRERSTGELETYHDRMRQTIVGGLQADQIKDYHLRLAFALEAHGHSSDKETLAVHFHAGGDLARAALYAEGAAAEAAHALAFDRAARLYRLALEAPNSDASRPDLLHMKLGDALSNAGRGDEAAQAYLKGAEEAGDASLRLELRRRAAEQLLISGRVDGGLEVLRTVLASVGLRLPRTSYGALLSAVVQRAWLQVRGIKFRSREANQVPVEDLIRIDACGTVAMGLAGFDPVRGLTFAIRHLLLALSVGERSRVCRALATAAAYDSFMGTASRRRADLLLAESLNLADQTANPIDHTVATMMTGMVHFMSGEWVQARKLGLFLEDSVGRAKAALIDSPFPLWEFNTTKLTSYTTLHLSGDFRELINRIPLAIRDAQDRGDRFTITSVGSRLLPFVHLAADQPEEARRAVERTAGDWSSSGFYMQHYFFDYGAAEVDLYTGDAEAARTRIRNLWRRRNSFLTRVQVILIEARHLQGRAAIALAAQGVNEAQMIRDAQAQVRIIERERTQWGDPLATLLRAGIASVRGETEKTLALMASAEAGLEKSRMMHYLAATRSRRGEMLGGPEGARLVAAAQSYYDEHGIKNPSRMTAALVPGRWSSASELEPAGTLRAASVP